MDLNPINYFRKDSRAEVESKTSEALSQLNDEPTATSVPSSPPIPKQVPSLIVVPPQVETSKENVVRVKFACRVEGLLESDAEAISICREIVKDVFPNGKAKEAYRYVRDFDAEPRLQRVQFTGVASEGLEQLGLNVSKGLPKGAFKIEGVPTRDFEGSIVVSVTVDYSTPLFADGQKIRKDATIRNYAHKSQFIINADPWDLWKELEPNENLPYRKAHGESFSRLLPTEPPLVLLAASRRGRSHAQEGKFRDDHFVVDAAKSPDDWTIVAVADGAGSAKFSRKGSEIACENAVKTLRQKLAPKAANGDKLVFDAHLIKEWEKRFEEANAQKDAQKDAQRSPDAAPQGESVEAESSDDGLVLTSNPEAENLPDAPDSIKVILDNPPSKGTYDESNNETTSDADARQNPSPDSQDQNKKFDEWYKEAWGDSSKSDETSNETDALTKNATPIDAANASETSVAPAETQTSTEAEPNSETQEELASTPKQDALKKSLFNCLYHAVYHAYKAINDEADAISKEFGERARINDFNTTLLLAALKKLPATETAPTAWVVLTYWVGDGAMAVYNPDGKEEILTLGSPDGGEFAGQTRFLTMRDEIDDKRIAARSRLVFLHDFDKIALMTDGVSDPFFPAEKDFQSYARWKDFWAVDMPKHMEGVIDTNASLEEREKALLDGLMFKVPGNHDDRTLLLILNEQEGKANAPSSAESRKGVELENSASPTESVPPAEIEGKQAKNLSGDEANDAREEGREG